MQASRWIALELQAFQVIAASLVTISRDFADECDVELSPNNSFLYISQLQGLQATNKIFFSYLSYLQNVFNVAMSYIQILVCNPADI